MKGTVAEYIQGVNSTLGRRVMSCQILTITKPRPRHRSSHHEPLRPRLVINLAIPELAPRSPNLGGGVRRGKPCLSPMLNFADPWASLNSEVIQVRYDRHQNTEPYYSPESLKTDPCTHGSHDYDSSIDGVQSMSFHYRGRMSPEPDSSYSPTQSASLGEHPLTARLQQ